MPRPECINFKIVVFKSKRSLYKRHISFSFGSLEGITYRQQVEPNRLELNLDMAKSGFKHGRFSVRFCYLQLERMAYLRLQISYTSNLT